MEAILPHMLACGEYAAACELAGFDPRAAQKADVTDIRNPVVLRVFREVRRQFSAICREFGFLPGRVHVELLREVGKSGEERNRISRGLERRTKEKEAARKAVAQLLGKSPETVSAGEVQRYELWRQQDGKCAYYMLWRHAGGERAYGDAMPQGSIPPDWLADGVNAVQVDHILPRSRTFDNSFHNLCLCCHAANQAKGGRTPWEWLGAAQPQAWHDFEQWVQSLPLKGLKKRNYLLRDLNAEVQGRFHARNLTDSGYVARLTLRWLEEEYARHDVPMQDADGRTLYTATALGSMSSVIFSSSDIKEGETYTVLVDGASVGTATAKLGTSSSSSGSLGPNQNGGQPGSGQQGGVSGFQDVGQNDWFASAVRYVTGKSLMNGKSTTAFAPNENMSRAMLATVLYRMSGETAEADSSFRDVSSSAYYAAAVNWASSEGIVNGTGANAFSPNASITREQLAAMLYLHGYRRHLALRVEGSRVVRGEGHSERQERDAPCTAGHRNARGVRRHAPAVCRAVNSRKRNILNTDSTQADGRLIAENKRRRLLCSRAVRQSARRRMNRSSSALSRRTRASSCARRPGTPVTR